jgi:hypothetical protein
VVYSGATIFKVNGDGKVSGAVVCDKRDTDHGKVTAVPPPLTGRN